MSANISYILYIFFFVEVMSEFYFQSIFSRQFYLILVVELKRTFFRDS